MGELYSSIGGDIVAEARVGEIERTGLRWDLGGSKGIGEESVR